MTCPGDRAGAGAQRRDDRVPPHDASSSPTAAPANVKHQGFGHQLAEHAPAAGADRQPDGDFLPPRDAAREQQVRDARAGDRQQEHDERHQEPQRLAELVSDSRESRAPRLERGLAAEEHRPPFRRHVGPRRRFHDRRPRGLQRRVGLLARHPVFQSPHQVQPRRSGRSEGRRGMPPVNGNEELGLETGRDAEEPRRGHADHRVGQLRDPDRPADDRVVGAEVARPGRVAEDRDRRVLVPNVRPSAAVTRAWKRTPASLPEGPWPRVRRRCRSSRRRPDPCSSRRSRRKRGRVVAPR